MSSSPPMKFTVSLDSPITLPSFTLSPGEFPFDFPVWYRNYSRLTMKSRVFPLSNEFLHYLLEDSIEIPENYQPIRRENFTVEIDDDDEEKNFPLSENKNSMEENKNSEEFFPALMKEIENSINLLGGSIFPRLNSVSLTDAAWISTERSCRCQSVGDLLLLLKSSDRIAEEISKPRDSRYYSSVHHLIVRRWSNLHESREFRLFIFSGHFVGISQQKLKFFPFLQDEQLEENFRILMEDFYLDQIRGFPVSDFICDIYIDLNEKIWILDFKPLNSEQNCRLFNYEELKKLSERAKIEEDFEYEYRIVKDREFSDLNIPNAAKSIANRLPEDGIDLSDAKSIESFVERVTKLGLTGEPGRNIDEDDSDQEN